MLDASAAIELVLRTGRADAIAARAFGSSGKLHAPHLIDLEVAQVLRRLALAREIAVKRAEQALEYFRMIAIERHAHVSLIERIWSLKTALSACDAAYVALAEALAAPLLTCDEKLSGSHGHAAMIELVTA